MAPLYPGVPFYHLKKQKESGERKERVMGERPFRVLRMLLNRIRIGENRGKQ